jgi:dienelactone hydrolase
MVVWGHDIFGWDSGRTKELVDRLAAETEYMVVLPDLFRGVIAPEAPSYEWETVLQVRLC